MKFLKYYLFTLITVLFVAGATSLSVAQSRDDAVEAFNKAIDLASKGNYEQAINSYTEAIAIANELGEEGQDIVTKSKDALPKLYYQSALNIYKEYKQSPSVSKIDEAIDTFKTAEEKANEFDNNEIASQAEGVITQLYNQKALLQY